MIGHIQGCKVPQGGMGQLGEDVCYKHQGKEDTVEE